MSKRLSRLSNFMSARQLVYEEWRRLIRRRRLLALAAAGAIVGILILLTWVLLALRAGVA